MKSAKDEVRSLLDNLPDDASLEDIQYHLYVRQKVLKGLDASDNGQLISHEEAVKRMSRWLDA
jgi:predicted transcriptional regulator